MMRHVVRSLLGDALDAHGGLARWRDLKGLSSTIVTGGRLWALKGIELTPEPRTATTEFHRQWTTVAPFGQPDWTMTWVPNRVTISDGAGLPIAERDAPRESFAGHVRDTPWDPLHLAYFNGYAMWTYHALPFVLAEPGYEVSDVAPIVQDGRTLQGLGARFPKRVHSHSRDQRFYFGRDGLLARHDYSVDVWADTAAAHILSDYVEADGLLLPTRRRVHPRRPDGSFDAGVEIVTVDLSNYVPR
jgi:hypothetical protein